MYLLNLHWEQVAALELCEVKYTLVGRNPDRITFKVSFEDIKEYSKALEILIRR